MMGLLVKGAKLVLLAIVLVVPPSVSGADDPPHAQLVAPDGVPYDGEQSQRLMQVKALSPNLLRNGGFERGRYWPAGWQFTDGLTTFWVAGGTEGERCVRIYTDVLDVQWKRHEDEVRRAVEAAMRKHGDPQSAPQDPRPSPPERVPTQPPFYDTVAGLHGVHYRSDYVPVAPRAVYRFSIDARCEVNGEPHEPRVFIKGFFDQQVQTRNGVETVRRNAYRAPMILDPCDKQWRRYARLFHPWRSNSTLAGEQLRAERLQVQIYAYWRPGNYYFDNARLEIVDWEEPETARDKEPQRPMSESRPEAPLSKSGFPVLDP